MQSGNLLLQVLGFKWNKCLGFLLSVVGKNISSLNSLLLNSSVFFQISFSLCVIFDLLEFNALFFWGLLHCRRKRCFVCSQLVNLNTFDLYYECI